MISMTRTGQYVCFRNCWQCVEYIALAVALIYVIAGLQINLMLKGMDQSIGSYQRVGISLECEAIPSYTLIF